MCVAARVNPPFRASVAPPSLRSTPMPRTRRIFPGYPVAAVATVAMFATAPGQTFIVAQLNTDEIRSQFGISQGGFNATYTIATVLAALPLVITGAMVDRLGPRRMLAIVASAFAMGCLVMSAAQGLATLFLGFFCLRFLGQGSLSLVASHSVAMWFHRRLGTVSGVKTVLQFGLWAFLPQLTLVLFHHLGWRWTYAVFAGAIVVLVVPAALLFVQDRPEQLGLRTDNDPPDAPHGPRTATAAPPQAEPGFTLAEARRTGAYWILASTSVLPAFIGTAILFDMIPIAAERGLTPAAAAAAVSAWSLTMAVVAIPAGIITDRANPAVLITLAMLIAAAATVGITLAASAPHIAVAMVVYGLGMSISSACAAATVARYFGRLHHGRIRSSLTRLAVIGTGFGPLTTGLCYEATGSYTPVLWVFAGLTLAAALVTSTLRPPAQPPAPPPAPA